MSPVQGPERGDPAPPADLATALRGPDVPPRSEPPTTVAALPAALDRQVRTLIDASAPAARGADPAAPLRTEIELAPEELGRVRIVLRDTAQGLHLQIAADRPETLELVRRHVEGLQRSLASDGVTLAGLELSGGGLADGALDEASRQAAAPTGGDPEEDAGASEDPAGAAPDPQSTSRLDLRL